MRDRSRWGSPVTRRIGSVPYLNARPLVEWFSRTAEGRESGIEVVEAPPSQLSDMIAAGEIECGLVSSVESFRPGYSFVPGIGISAEGPVESVRVFHRPPIESVKRIALDTSSKTSVALLRILCRNLFRIDPSWDRQAPDLDSMLRTCDAALMIGDRGFEPADGVEAIDLGSAWRTLTGLPFVYALWIGRRESLDVPLIDALNRAKDWGMPRLERSPPTRPGNMEPTRHAPCIICGMSCVSDGTTNSRRDCANSSRFVMKWTSCPEPLIPIIRSCGSN